MRRFHNIIIILVVISFSTIMPQQLYQGKSLLDAAGQLDGRLTSNQLNLELDKLFNNILNNSEILNVVLKETLQRTEANNFLKNLNVKFKTFQFDTASSLGLSYSFQKSIKNNFFSITETSSSGISFLIDAEGEVAFKKNLNPENFLKSAVSFKYFNSSGGVVEISDELSDSLTQIQKELSKIQNADSLNNSSLWKSYLNQTSNFLTTQCYYEFALLASLESNQDFSSKNYVYSANLGLDIKAWNRNSILSQLNIFDWPFAITRWLTGMEDNLYPRGSSIPTLLFDISYVDPSGDPIRKAINETKFYPRFNFEAGFKTLLSNVSGNPIYFSADIRYYKEFNASQAVKNLSLNESLYFVAAMTHKDGLFVSYAVGKLPYDKKNDEVYSIGFNYNF